MGSTRRCRTQSWDGCYLTVKVLVLVTVPPTDVVTLMDPVVAPTGTVVVSFLAESCTIDACVPSNVTFVASERWVPEMVTFLPTLPFSGRKV